MTLRENSLWTYSLTIYGQAGIESRLLALQDGYGADVNFLLAVIWLAVEGRLLTASALELDATAYLDRGEEFYVSRVPGQPIRNRKPYFGDVGELTDYLQ